MSATKHQQHSNVQEAELALPTPGGEGWGEGGRFTFIFFNQGDPEPIEMNPKPLPLWQRGILPRISLFGFVLWFFRWRNLRRCLFVLACLATFVALFYAEENWRGRHAWEKFKREQEAKGEMLDLAA